MVGTSAVVAFLTRKAVEGAAQCGDGADDHGASRHLDSVLCGGQAVGLADRAAGAPTLSRPARRRQAVASNRLSARDVAPGVSPNAR